jgi:hypothetical protein
MKMDKFNLIISKNEIPIIYKNERYFIGSSNVFDVENGTLMKWIHLKTNIYSVAQQSL